MSESTIKRRQLRKDWYLSRNKLTAEENPCLYWIFWRNAFLSALKIAKKLIENLKNKFNVTTVRRFLNEEEFYRKILSPEESEALKKILD